MDANKDEAIKCLNIAKNSMDRSRALKFLNKARRLDPSIPIDESLSKLLQQEDKNPNETTNQKPFKPLTSSEQMKRKREQVAVVTEIERKNNYYEILGLEKNSSAQDIRRAYRKLSPKVHPDKNGAPGAEDSFKKLLQAFQCLSNEESRRKYDLETSPANKRVRVSQTVSSVSRSSRTRMHISFGVNANVLTAFNEPYTMEEVMIRVRSRARMFKLSGNFRLKYEYQGKTIVLPKEDDLEADNELRTCIHRLTSLPNIFYITIFAEMI